MALIDGRITNRACKLEVAGLIEEAKADIHVDPLLHKACVLDIQKYCVDVPQGAGRSKRISEIVPKTKNRRLGNGLILFVLLLRLIAVLQCLQMVLSSSSQHLHPDCKLKLTQRMEMFKNAEPLVCFNKI